MIQQHKESNIYLLYVKEEYKECISECIKYIKTLKKSDNIQDSDVQISLWFAYLRISLCCKQLGRYRDSIVFAKNSMEYSELDSKTIQSYWAIAKSYEFLNKEKSLKYYDVAINIADKNGFKESKIELLANKAGFTGDELEIKRILIYYTNSEDIIDENKMVLDAIYENYVKVLLKQGNKTEANYVLHSIRSKVIKGNLLKAYTKSLKAN